MNVKGTCHILYCLDLARGIDLLAAEERLTSWRRASFQHKSRVLTGDAVLPPLRVRFDSGSFSAGNWEAEPEIELALYNLGAMCVTWRIPFDGALESLVELSTQLYDNVELMKRSRKLAQEIVSSLGPAADRPAISDLIEDYVVFEVTSFEGDVQGLVSNSSSTLARVLRAEKDELSTQEIEDALADHVSYRAQEICFVDWLGAFMCGPEGEDERLVLELATVELLGLRLLDSQLDQEINEAAYLMQQPHRRFGALTIQRHELQRIGGMQAEGAVLHQGIDNALKLLGDDYLARVYRTAAERFHFNDWDSSIERKLDVLRNVYQSLADQTSHRRSEILEWIIIVLIAVDIVLYFTPFR